jgi:GTP pyrophosphokinase
MKNELEELSLTIEPEYSERCASRWTRSAGPRGADRAPEGDHLAKPLRHRSRRWQLKAASSASTAFTRVKRQKIELEQVYDFIALGSPEHQDCYGVLGIIHQTWSPVPGRIRTSSQCPGRTATIAPHPLSANQAPRSRSRSDHGNAPDGGGRVAAHWKYKEGRVGDQRDDRYFGWMRN